MALGGGTFTEMNMGLPGAYINNISATRTLNLEGENGIVAIPIQSDFGNEGEIFELKPTDFKQDSLVYFGYPLFSKELKGLRELFENSKKVYACVLNQNTKAENDLAIAKKGGSRGNDIYIKIQNNIDLEDKKDVYTYIDNILIDKQTVKDASELRENAMVTFKPDGVLTETVSTRLANGKTGEVTNKQHINFLKKLETISFNTLACMATDKELQKLYIAYTKRMREEIGLKFATVMASVMGVEYDYEGVVVIDNKIDEEGAKGNELVPFTSAIYANCQLGKSNLNREYTGEYKVNTDYTQLQLKNLIKKGMFVYHKVGDTVRVLEDINSLVTVTESKGIEFKDNQVVRILDALATSDAMIFNNYYLGKVNIDKAGIESYENKVIELRERFEELGAIKEFDPENVKVEKVEGVRGAIKVDSIITPAECFRQLYLTNMVKQ